MPASNGTALPPR